MARAAQSAAWVALSVCLATPAAARSLSPALYQATAIVTGTDMRERPRGFAECLTEVLVKLSGRPALARDPRVARLAADAERLVASYHYVDPRAGLLHHDDQGTYDRPHELTVRFDPEKTDRALASLGLQPWEGERPLLTPVILVRDRDPEPFYLSAGTPRGVQMRAAMVRIAASHGLGVHFPTEAELDAWGLDTIGFPSPLHAAAPGRLRVVGTLSLSLKAGGWIGTWASGEHRWQVSGVGYDKAFANLVEGAEALVAPDHR